MGPAHWIAVGIGGWLTLGMVMGIIVDRDIREGATRLLLAPVLVPLLLVTALGMKLPKFTRSRVTADSLMAALDDNQYVRHTTAINWPGGALVLLRSSHACQVDGCTNARRHTHTPIRVSS